MKVTKQELQKIIKEEFNAMTVAGDLEEGFLDKLLGKQPRFDDFVTDGDVKNVLNKAISALTDLVRIASRQENKALTDKAAELKRQAMSLSSMSTPAGSNMPPKPGEFPLGRTPPRIRDRAPFSENKKKPSK
jgi:hypothetical protein